MDIAVIGASGRVGSRLVEEALNRGHWVTGICRHPGNLPIRDGLRVEAADALDVQNLIRILRGHDVVVSAVPFRAVPACPLIEAVRHSRVPRYLVVGGAGSLEVSPGVQLVDTPEFPKEYLEEARRGREFLRALQSTEDLDWTFLSPAALFEPGQRTGRYRLGQDSLLLGPDGRSRISMEDYAIAMLDEIEKPRHPRQRFTVAW